MADVDYDFTGTDDDPWDADVFPVVRNWLGTSDPPTIQGNQGVMQTAGSGLGPGDRHGIVAVTEEMYTDTEVIVKMDPTFGSFPSIGYRVNGPVGSGYILTGYELQYWGDDDKNEMNVWDNNAGYIVAYARGLTSINHDEPYWWHLYCRGNRHRVRWWPESGTEPSIWYMDFTDTAFVDPGRVYISTVNQSSGDPSTLIVDDFYTHEIVPPDPGIRLGSTGIVGLHIAVDASTWDDVTGCYVVGDDLEPVEIPVP